MERQNHRDRGGSGGGGGGGGSSRKSGGGGGGGGGSSKSSNAAAVAAAQAIAEQHQRNNLLMELAAGGSNNRNLAELFAAHHQQQQQQQQQQLAQQQLSHLAASLSTPTTSASNSSQNPLSLLQQQMNAIMQTGGNQPPTSSANNNSAPFNNPAAAWWYLEYLSRIQAAQIIPNLEVDQQQQQSSSSQSQSQSQQQQQQRRPKTKRSEGGLGRPSEQGLGGGGASGGGNSSRNNNTNNVNESSGRERESRESRPQDFQRQRQSSERDRQPTPTSRQQVPAELPLQMISSLSTPPQPARVEGKRTSGNKRKHTAATSSAADMLNAVAAADALNLSKMSRATPPQVKIPKLLQNSLQSSQPLVASLPASCGSGTPAVQPPMAHSTPINLSTPPGKYSGATKEPLPAHINNKPALYTHMIPKFPQIGLIGNKTKSENSKKKKTTVANLLAQNRSPPPNHHLQLQNQLANLQHQQEISYRPWLEDKLIIPNIHSSKKEQPDYNLPLKMGWKRETLVKNTCFTNPEDFENIEGTVFYITNTGIKCKSVNEIKKHLNQRTAEMTPKHFSFNSSILLGSYVFDFEGEKLTLEDKILKEGGNVLKTLKFMKSESIFQREQMRMKLLQEEKEREDKERRRQHQALIKSLEILKKNKRRIKLQNERKLKKRLAQEEVEEVKKSDDQIDELDQNDELKEIEKLETCLEPPAFSNLLQIYEFLNTFGETLGFDMESLPCLESLLKGFINHPENEEELQSILIHLIVCAVEDPGMPNPTKHLTTFNQTLKQADVTFGSLSEILRLYLEGISDSEPEAEIYSNWLSEAPFTTHNPKRKTIIVAFLCDILLQNKAVLKHLENSTELIHNCKKERQQNDIKIRKLRMVLARKAVASACEDTEKKDTDSKDDKEKEDGATTPAPIPITKEEEKELSDEEENTDNKLSMDELKAKMGQLQNTNEKLKKQMQMNIKSIRTNCLGQDRYRRRYWNLPNSGGIFVEGGKSGEFADLGQLIKEKFATMDEPMEEGDDEEPDEPVNNTEEKEIVLEDEERIKDIKSAAKIIVESVDSNEISESNGNQVIKEEVGDEDTNLKDNSENIPPTPATPASVTNNSISISEPHTPNPITLNNNLSNNNSGTNKPFEVPPPCIKIFSFLTRETLCSGKHPVVQHDESLIKQGPTDDELLVSKITKDKWDYYYCIREDKELKEFCETLLDGGVREKDLKMVLEGAEIKNAVPHFEDTEVIEGMDEVGVDPDLVYKIHLGLIETLETLEERVANASLQIKGWTLPLPRLQYQNSTLSLSEIVEIVKTRVLDLEQAVERRYLKPPLGKSANELNLSNLVGEDNANALNTNEVIINGPPCGSTSSTRGQQIQENNKMKELKEKEERMQQAAESKNSCSRFLTHWRTAITSSTSPSVLSMAIYLLDSSIAWDKSVMKASCQLCKGGDNEDKLLLCDACDRGYHTYCFKPPLEQIPEGDWFCWECINKATGNRGCIVCGKGNLAGKKLLACDKCVKAYHTDCIYPPVTKVPRGRWYCPDHHQPVHSTSHSHHTTAARKSETLTTVTSPKKKQTPSKPVVVPAAIPPRPPSVEKKEPVAPSPVARAVSPVAVIEQPTTPASATPESIPAAALSPPPPPPVTSPPPPPPPPPVIKKPSKKLKKEMEWCEKVLDDLMGHEDAWPFLEPVNTRQFPTYKKVIKTPMDLSTIKKSLQSTTYKSRECFLTDVRLIFDNCETFNEDDSPVGKAGHNLRIFFESFSFNDKSNDSNSNN